MFQYFFSKILPSLASLAVILIAIRYLGPLEYGMYALIVATVLIITTLSFGWIRQSIHRFMCSDKENIHLLVNRFFYLTFFSIILSALILALVLYYAFRLGTFEMIAVIVYAGLYTMFMFHIAIHQARQQSRAAAISEAAFQLINLGLICFFVIHLGLFDYRMMFISMAMALAITETGRLIFVSRIREPVEITHVFWDTRFSQKVIEYGRPLTLWIVLSLVLSLADRFILKIFHGYSTTGIYSAISDILQIIITLFCMPILMHYHPKILEQWNANHRKEAMVLLRDAVSFDVLIGLVIFIAVMILRDSFYIGFLGLQDRGIFAVSVILVIDAFLWQLILMFQKPLETFARRKFKVTAILVTVVVNLAGNLIFVPRFGYYASAVVMFCSYVIYLVLIFVIYRNLVRETADQHVSR